MILYPIIAILITLLDQLTKYLTATNISLGEGFTLIPGLFDITYVQNTGAAFSMLSDSTVFLSIISFLFCIGIIIYWCIKKPVHPLLRTSLTMLFAGAFGNGIDRLFRGFVVDFIETTFINFPVFNVADIAVTCGAALLIIYVIFFDKDDEQKHTDRTGNDKQKDTIE